MKTALIAFAGAFLAVALAHTVDQRIELEISSVMRGPDKLIVIEHGARRIELTVDEALDIIESAKFDHYARKNGRK